MHIETIRPQDGKLTLQQANPCDRDKRVHLSESNHLYYLDGASMYTIGVTELLRITKSASSVKKRGVDKSEVLAEFEDATITLHNNIHSRLNDCDAQLDDEGTSTEFGYFTSWLAQRRDLFPYRSQWMIFDDESCVCGTVDALFTNAARTRFLLVHWKRQQSITAEMKKKWRLQLNMYAHILSKNYNIEVACLMVIVLHPSFEAAMEVTLELQNVESIFATRTLAVRRLEKAFDEAANKWKMTDRSLQQASRVSSPSLSSPSPSFLSKTSSSSPCSGSSVSASFSSSVLQFSATSSPPPPPPPPPL